MPAWARGSGGYSRPSSGGYSRTPSFSGGGYSRGGSSSFGQSAGDRSFSRERSGNALGAYRQQQEFQRRQREYQPPPSYSGPSYSGPSYSGPSYSAPSMPGWMTQPRDSRGRWVSRNNDWYSSRGWAPSSYYTNGPRSFGVWDGLFLWSLLSNLNRSGSTDWFSNHRDDPGYQQWRQEAERQAATNAELKQRLDELDRQLAAKQGQPADPAYLPPDVPPEVAAAPPPARTPSTADIAPAGPAPSHGGIWVWPVLAVGAGGLGYLAYARGRSPSSGSPIMSQSGGAIGQAANIVRHKLSGQAYTPDRFRVGMTIQLDPTPFILAGAAIKVPQFEGGAAGQVSVTAIGQVESGGTRLMRLYLPDEHSVVQLHLDKDGMPDECRFFGAIDEVTPADPAEWGAWLDNAEGMIGWPEFQTKDGKTYARVWSPGDARVTPRVLTESVQSIEGTRAVKSQAMLYAAPTGAPDPAPKTEYILVQAIEDGTRAYVQISAGIDINSTTLQLA